jgi:hypothetical protein
MTTYRELLRDPRWQKKRLETLESAAWACERCMDSESTLHVHHKRYVKGRMPWEYARWELAVLCETCHEVEHEEKARRDELLLRLQLDGPLSIEDFMAYGAGALHWFAGPDGMCDDRLRALLVAAGEGKPNQYAAARIGAALMAGVTTLSRDALPRAADQVEAPDGALLAELLRVIRVATTE